MKHAMISMVVLMSVFSAHAAGWTGDVLCLKGRYPKSLVADGVGSIQVTNGETADPIVQVRFHELRLFSEYGMTQGSVFKDVVFVGSSVDGNDSWYGSLKVDGNTPTIDSLELDLSSLDRGLSTLKTKKGNTYVLDCIVRQH